MASSLHALVQTEIRNDVQRWRNAIFTVSLARRTLDFLGLPQNTVCMAILFRKNEISYETLCMDRMRGSVFIGDSSISRSGAQKYNIIVATALLGLV